MEKHDPYAAFRVKAYRLYVAGWFAALIGNQIQSTAIGWEMYQRTGEALALGFVGLAIALPTMILALPGGYLADVFNRKTVVVLSLMGTTLTSIALAVLSWKQGSIGWMYAILVVDASVTVLGSPARRSLLPQLVPRDVFPNAVTWSTSMMQSAWMVGPALGGLIVAINVPLAYVASAGCTAWFVMMLLRMEIRPVERDEHAPKPSAMENLFGGLRFIGRNRLLLWLMSLDMFAVLLGGAVYLLSLIHI